MKRQSADSKQRQLRKQQKNKKGRSERLYIMIPSAILEPSEAELTHATQNNRHYTKPTSKPFHDRDLHAFISLPSHHFIFIFLKSFQGRSLCSILPCMPNANNNNNKETVVYTQFPSVRIRNLAYEISPELRTAWGRRL